MANTKNYKVLVAFTLDGVKHDAGSTVRLTDEQAKAQGKNVELIEEE